jgi:hypothetical protein
VHKKKKDRHGRATDSISRGPGAELGSGICAADVDGVFVRWISIPWPGGMDVCIGGFWSATLGRSALANMTHRLVRNRWMSDVSRERVDSLKGSMEKRPKLTFDLFLFYAFTPLPSNFWFIAYGLTTMHLARLAIPFFVGRFASYFWTLSAAAVSRRFDFDDGTTLSYFSV